jgi:hypothetical protein
MKVRKSRKSRKKRPFFDPEVITTEILQAIRCDLEPFIQEQRGVHSSTHFAMRRQIDELLKKFVPSTQATADLEKQTFRLFREVNQHMLDTNIRLLFNLPSVDMRIQSWTPFEDKVHLRARAIAHWILGTIGEDEWFLECKNSSGATSGVPYIDTSEEAKFTFPMSSTSGAERYFNRYLDFDFQLKSALIEYNSERPSSGGIDLRIGSRATTVDKTVDKRRMICVEPTVNMFLQQGLMQVMYSRLKAVGLDVDSLQVEHKDRAREASITCREGTVDFSSASDCVSIELLRWVLPPVWFDYLWALRSDHTLIEGEWLQLHMMSTMGNATTFPLETLIFWAYGHAIRLSLRAGNSLFPEWEDLRSISVYGDDCIVPSSMAKEFCEFMEKVGFRVNWEKSYIGSYQFRESCGGDYLAGMSVRPYFLKAPEGRRKSDLAPWLYIITNSFIQKYISYFGELAYVYDKELWKVLFGIFSRHNIVIRFVPPDYPDDSGLKWFFDRERLGLLYSFLSEPVYEDEHGTRTFTFHSFRYKERYEQDGLLRYTLGLKKKYKVNMLRRGSVKNDFGFFHLQKVESRRETSFMELLPLRELPRTNPRRRIGGYFVAEGISAHWTE